MMIYNLVFICVVTFMLLVGSFESFNAYESAAGSLCFILALCGILAIIFQSINL